MLLEWLCDRFVFGIEWLLAWVVVHSHKSVSQRFSPEFRWYFFFYFSVACLHRNLWSFLLAMSWKLMQYICEVVFRICVCWMVSGSDSYWCNVCEYVKGLYGIWQWGLLVYVCDYKSWKGHVLAIAPLTWIRLATRSALQSRKWQLIGMS